jgi:2-oxoglutarate dehydrogenase complex dehydrogenase (E1) component-like enzyme
MPDRDQNEAFGFGGDAKYHLGTSFTREYPDGK